MRFFKSTVIMLAGVMMLGCAAKLKNPVQVRAPVAYLMKKDRTYQKATTGDCVREVSKQVVYLPGGESYELDFSRGVFASSQFTVQLNESGTLKQVSLNSDPQVDEAIAAVGGLVEKVAGVAALVAPLIIAKVIPEPDVCIPGVSLRFALLDCFLDPQPPNPGILCPPDPNSW